MRLPTPILFALAALGGAFGLAAPSGAATQTAAVTANAVKPLVLTKMQDLDLGTVTLGPGTWPNATIGISQAGALSCTSTNLVCTGATMAALICSRTLCMHLTLMNL